MFDLCWVVGAALALCRRLLEYRVSMLPFRFTNIHPYIYRSAVPWF